MSGELRPGSVIAGHRIEAVAGRGGMGVVYRARELALDRLVALKVVAHGLADDPAFRERFRRESKIAASLDHPNVIPVFGAGEEDGLAWIAMRYVEGDDLRSLVRREGPLDPARAARIVSQVAAALDAAHATGLVHRDVKPANVLLGPGDHAYLTDFGLTKHALSVGDATRTGQWVGSVDYVAPEQITGDRLDARADVYALGGVLWWALTGEVPFPRDRDEAKLWAHVNLDPPGDDRVSPGLAAVVRRAMAKSPDDRFPSAGDLGRAALAAAEDRPVREPERRVARGPAAPAGAAGEEDTISGTRPTQLAPEDTTRLQPGRVADRPHPGRARRATWPALLALAVLLLAAGVAAALMAGGGEDSPGGSGATTTTTAPARSATARVGRRPNGIAVTEDAVYVSSTRDGTITRIDRDSLRRAEGLLDGVTGVAAADGRLWAIRAAAKQVVQIDPRTLRPVEGGTIQLAEDERPYSVRAAGRNVWVGTRPGQLVKIDARRHVITRRVLLRDGMETLDVGEGSVYVLGRRANAATRIPINGDPTKRRPLIGHGGQLGRPRDVAVDGRFVWIIHASDSVLSRYDLNLADQVDRKFGTRSQRVDAASGQVWVADQLENDAQRIDPQGFTELGRPLKVAGTNPSGIAVDPPYVWVTSQDGTLTRLRPPGA
jgi:DNA-binding beta-propeller fold protein YncE/predicted Ser/Thr protein kinase